MKNRLLTIVAVFLLFSGSAQNAFNFDGANDFLSVGNPTSVQLTGSEITLEAWIYPTSWRSQVWEGNIINKEQGGGADNGYMLRCGDGGKLNFNIGNGGWTEVTSVAGVLSLNTWQHVAGTYDGSIMRIYVDGVEVGNLNTSTTIGNASSSDLVVGNWSNGTGRGFPGNIDDVRLWNVARTLPQIQAEMNRELCSPEAGLVLNFQLNEGIASGNNSGISTAVDFSTNGTNGTFSNVNMTGGASNFVTGIVSGSNSSIDVVELCDATDYTWTNGVTYSSDNSTATQNFTNMNGCDSIVTLNLTFNNSNTGVDLQNGCIGSIFTWIDGNDYDTDNSTATHTVTNIGGCDSVVTLNLTFTNNANTGTDIQTRCGGSTYIWINGVSYTSDNSSATHTLTNIAGCDSVVTLDLNFLAISNGVDIQSVCDSLIWIDGNTYYSDNNSATYTIDNGAASGCDSIVTLNLTINTVDNAVTVADPTLMANQMGGTYKWLDCNNNQSEIVGETSQSFAPLLNGEYSVEVTHNGCVDTSMCFTIETVSFGESDFELPLLIYPNPTEGHVTLNLGKSLGNAQIIIEDINGVMVYSKNITNTNAVEFDLSELTAGVYILKVKSMGNQKVIRLVKE